MLKRIYALLGFETWYVWGWDTFGRHWYFCSEHLSEVRAVRSTRAHRRDFDRKNPDAGSIRDRYCVVRPDGTHYWADEDDPPGDVPNPRN